MSYDRDFPDELEHLETGYCSVCGHSSLAHVHLADSQHGTSFYGACAARGCGCDRFQEEEEEEER